MKNHHHQWLLASLLLSPAVTAFTTTTTTTTTSRIHQKQQQQQRRRHSNTQLWYKNEDDMNDNMDDNMDDNDNDNNNDETDVVAMNVLGTALRPCCGHSDDGGGGGDYCSIRDLGDETVCCQVTERFLTYSKDSLGVDLSRPQDDGTPGLRPGDIGCITVEEWAAAYNNGMAPYLFLESTHKKTLEYVGMLDFLQVFAIDLDEANKRLDDLNEDRARLENLL